MKHYKFLITLLITFIFIFSAFAFTACSPNCQGLTIPSNQSSGGDSASGSSNNNGTSNNNGGATTGDDKEESIIDKLSNITITIETDPYYRGLAQKNTDNYQYITNDILPVPYKFLREHGHNVDAYLDGALNAFASSYIFDNDHNHIYVSVKAENVSGNRYGNYYTNYVLKYPLTDQEYEDYITLSKSGCIQSLFFIQELDNQKTPEIVNEINIAVSSYNDMIYEYSQSPDINFKHYYQVEVDVYACNKSEIEVSVRAADVSHKYSTTFGKIKLIPTILTNIYTYDNNAIYVANPSAVHYGNLEEYQSTVQNITAFSHANTLYGTNPYSYDLFDKVNDKT